MLLWIVRKSRFVTPPNISSWEDITLNTYIHVLPRWTQRLLRKSTAFCSNGRRVKIIVVAFASNGRFFGRFFVSHIHPAKAMDGNPVFARSPHNPEVVRFKSHPRNQTKETVTARWLFSFVSTERWICPLHDRRRREWAWSASASCGR